ncbi:dTMP kinase [Parvularcula sp. LCG005]|uniref:dTMP kinase n=1 Tax=Parvularcula sp. LCG005 TaxID=3078805 RepID=UPI002943AFC3|nr:dTMP kinase [Parvularcula sp. LCG005]WOI54795.1 dTMP kinase [Parvularcula sp. LCG005]
MTGLFISFEGPEGAGKSTQISILAAHLRAAGHDVVLTREPGGTSAGESLRSVLLDPDQDWSPLAEALLMNAARDAHMRQVIVPALEAGQTVLCDRFCHSTRAYQGGGGDVDLALLKSIEKAVCTRMPDLILLFDLSPEEGLARAAARGRADRFEAKGPDYHSRVAAAFRAMADEPNCHLIDAAGTVDTVSARIRDAVDPVIGTAP